jgi:hypothetical protein
MLSTIPPPKQYPSAAISSFLTSGWLFRKARAALKRFRLSSGS